MEAEDIFSTAGDISMNDVIAGLYDAYEYCYDCEATGKGDDEGTKYENEQLTAYEHLKKLIDDIGNGLVKNVRIYTKTDYLNKRILKSAIEEVSDNPNVIDLTDSVLKITKYGYSHAYIMEHLKNKLNNPDQRVVEHWKAVKEMYLKHRDKVIKELKNT